jgi:hypothetical protein
MIALNGIKKIIRSLAPKRPVEDNNYTLSRQISAINLLCKFDKWNIEWTDIMSDEIGRVKAIETLLNYIE